MSRSMLRECASQASEIPEACVEAAVRACGGGLGFGLGSSGPRSGLEQRQRETLWKLRRAFEEAAAGELRVSEVLARLAGALAAAGEVAMLWGDAIESLIQEVEALYGTTPGQGAKKAEQVKAAVLYAVDRSVGSPAVAEPFLVRSVLYMVLDWVIDGLVLVLNRHELWTLSRESKRRATLWFRARYRVAACVLRVVAMIYGWIADRAPLEPRVRVVVDQLIAGEKCDLRASGEKMIDFFGWGVRHQKQILALVDIVATACVEAEAFVRMSGKEKRLYAESLVLQVIAMEFPGLVSTSIMDQIVRGAVGFSIDLIVRVFNKRGLFRHRGAGAASAAPAATAA